LFRAIGAGHGAILLVGDAPYYEPFGFARRHTLGLSLPGKDGALTRATGLVTPAGAREFPAHGAFELRRAA
jgi:predicted N-acetyltransferase YhbS